MTMPRLLHFPRFFRPHARAAALAALASTLAVPSIAPAQQIYRHVDRNGQVVFSDQPPAPNAQPVVPQGSAGADAGATGLPYELRQTVQRYPVTIYTRDDCGPCDAGRALLTTRGVPFSERQVRTAADAEALQRLSGQDALPLLSIGTQQLKGYSDGEWSQYLDAAGYPKSIALPPGYRRPPAQPMVAATPATPPADSAASTETARSPATAPPRGPTPQNPAGIQF